MDYRIHAINTGELTSRLIDGLRNGGHHPDVSFEQIKPYGYRTEIKLGDGSIVEGKMNPCLVWYIQGGDKEILIDTGLGSSEEVNKTMSRYGISQRAVKKPEWDIVEGLKKFDLKPNDIDIVIQTHLHFDHVANNEIFKKATFLVQKDEIPLALAPPPYFSWGYPKEFACHTLNVLDQTKVIDGDFVVVPGIEILRTGGHTPGSSAVLVDTARGWVAMAGDCVYNYRNIEFNWPPGSWYRLDELLRAWQMLRSRADIVVPNHDYEVYERFPEGEIG